MALRIFVDTSALLALLDEDDRFHRDAAETLKAIGPAAELLTHNYVHAEALALARRKLGNAAVERLVSELLPRLTTIWVDESLHGAALAALTAGTGSISLVDRVSFEVMRREGIDQAFAFDADFEAQGFRQPSIDARIRQGRRLSEAPAPYDAADEAELVSVSEIASRARRPISTVQSWRRRHPDFPVPMAALAAGPVWTWPVVEHWINGRTGHRARASRSARDPMPGML
ncbi:MAG: PIN domain-containing protein [Chloroflexota bacterium]